MREGPGVMSVECAALKQCHANRNLLLVAREVFSLGKRSSHGP